MKMKDDKLVETIGQLSDVDLSQYPIKDFTENFDKKQNEDKKLEIKMRLLRNKKKTHNAVAKRWVNYKNNIFIDYLIVHLFTKLKGRK